jgi:flagellar assembly protein FliH
LQQTGSATRNGRVGRIEVFEYPAGPDAPSLPAWEGWAMREDSRPMAGMPRTRDAAGGAMKPGCAPSSIKRLAEETRRSFEAGASEAAGGPPGRARGAGRGQAPPSSERARQAAELIESFAQERDRYLHAVEHEVVKLALAVAARILRREAQMDPLLLTGAVRVALGQLSGSTQVRLRVPAAELDLWTEAIALLPNLAVKPEVVPARGCGWATA